MHGGDIGPSGELGLKVIKAADAQEIRDRFDRLTAISSYPAKELSLSEVAHYGLPRFGLDERVNAWRTANFKNLVRGARRVIAARSLRLSNFYGSLYLTHIGSDGEIVEFGLASMRVVTTAGVNYIAADIAGGASDSNLFKFHGLGTGTNAEASGDTALQTELTTQYNPDSTRATGSQANPSGNVYRTVGTNTVDASAAVTEHGILTQAATGGGTLLDRSVFSVVNLASGDSLQSTYDLTLSAGG